MVGGGGANLYQIISQYITIVVIVFYLPYDR